MRMKAWISGVSAMGLLCSSVALAQQESLENQSESSSSQTQTSTQSAQHVRLSQIIGATAQSKDGQQLGQIEDIVVDPKTQQIQFAVLGKGGFLGIGEKMVPIPWQAVTVQKTPAAGQSGKPNLTVNIDRQKLQSAPTMEKNKNYSELSQPDYIITVYRFYEIQPVGVGSPGQSTESQSSSQEQKQ